MGTFLGKFLGTTLGTRLGTDLTPSAASAYGLSGWDASTALATAAGAGIAGSAVTGVSAIIVWSASAVPSATQQLASCGVLGNNGWLARVSSAGVMQLLCGNGAATATAPTRTVVAGDLNKLHVTCLSNDIAAVYHYHDSAQVGTSTALAGFAPSAANRTAMGSAGGGSQPALDFTIYSICGRDSHLTLADFQTICAATKAANTGRIALGGVTMDHQWNAPTSATVPATLSDQIGADAMSFVVGSEANLISASSAITWGF